MRASVCERESKSVCVREREKERESKSVCVWKRESVWDKWDELIGLGVKPNLARLAAAADHF